MTEAPKHFYETIDGWFWFQNAYDRLLGTLSPHNPSVFVEVGCFRGRSLAYLVVETRRRKLPVTIHAVDLWANTDVHEEFRQNTRTIRDQFVEHWADSVIAASTFPDDSCDVIWLDGDHSEASMRAELAAWWPKLKVGGFIGGDDWLSPIQAAVRERFGPTGFEIGQGTMHDGAPWPWWLVQK